MSLTPKGLEDAPRYIGPTNELVLDLRDQKLSSLLALNGLKGDIYTILDLSNNELTLIPTIEPRKRVRTVLLANNKLRKVPDLSWAPQLETLSLINNEISSLDQLPPFTSLESIYLMGNPVQNYRLALIKQIPTLKVIDFQRVKDAERKAADDLDLESVTITKTVDTPTKPQLDAGLIEGATTLDQLESLENLL